MFACKDAAGIWDDEKKNKQNVIRLQVVKYKYSVKKSALTHPPTTAVQEIPDLKCRSLSNKSLSLTHLNLTLVHF